jgi:hypothetical protein
VLPVDPPKRYDSGGSEALRVGRSRRGSFRLEQHIVGVAVPPVLVRLERPDQAMTAVACMRRRMLARRVVAAAHHATGLTEAEVNPIVATRSETGLAAD